MTTISAFIISEMKVTLYLDVWRILRFLNIWVSVPCKTKICLCLSAWLSYLYAYIKLAEVTKAPLASFLAE